MALPDGMAQRSDGAIWNPRPHADLSNFGRRAYLAGYSDGFHAYPFGAGDEGAFGAFSDYRPGFQDGRADADDYSLLVDANSRYSATQLEEIARGVS